MNNEVIFDEWVKNTISDGTNEWLWGTKHAGIGVTMKGYLYNFIICFNGQTEEFTTDETWEIASLKAIEIFCRMMIKNPQ